ncbi:MAG: DNA repair protein RecN [Flavobacteriales bacterium]
MLKHLSITNYAIIEQLDIHLEKGFTAITGETGAGKSILLGALSLILGQRADKSVLKDKEKKCIVEGEFEIELDRFNHFFESNELDFEQPNIIRREINSKGKSRAFINDTPVALAVLKELTSQLIDIHSQDETLNIQSNKFQLSVIDAFANNTKEVLSYSAKFTSYIKSKKELSSLVELASKAKLDVDYISFQAQEIADLQLKPNEKEKIESELALINNAEEIKSVLDYADQALRTSDQNLVLELKNITNLFSKISKCSEAYNIIYERLNSFVIDLEDLTNEIDTENGSVNFNPDNLTYLNSRLSSIYSVEQKHNVSTTEEIIQLLEKFKAQLSDTNSFDAKIDKLSAEIKKQEKVLFSEGHNISKYRVSVLKDLCIKIKADLSLLGMVDASFEVKHELLTVLSQSGIDSINFLFTANKGMEVVALKKAASGGELSRLMLVIKSILAKDKLSSIVFDEIDTGVSGDIADKMANIMNRMGEDMQVISITHLPQVAAKAKYHFKIYKENEGDTTITNLVALEKQIRIEELAKMLSGEKMSSAAIDNAKSLLNI